MSADGVRWVLLNASPDVRTQLAHFEAVAPSPGQLRGSGIAAVVLTNADIDHSAGLLVLREGGAPQLYTTRAVRRSLTEGLSIFPVLEAFGPVHWTALEPGAAMPLKNAKGESLGLTVEPFTVASRVPLYMRKIVGDGDYDEHSGDTIGLLLRDAHGGCIAYVPGVRDLDSALTEKLSQASMIFIDGTFYTDDEMVALGASTRTSRMMGHPPLSGDDGLIAYLTRFPNARRVLVHINNTNPVLDPASEARRALDASGAELGNDGMTFTV